MVSRLPRQKAQLEMKVGRGLLRPGGALKVGVYLSPERTFHVREGRVELVCSETYWAESQRRRVVSYPMSPSTYRRSKSLYIGKDVEPPSHPFTRRLVRLSETFLVDTKVLKGFRYRNDVSFAVPKDAPPSVKGLAADVSWVIRASLDVTRGANIHEEREVVVMTPSVKKRRGGVKQPASAVTAESAFEQCTMSLRLASGRVRAGGRGPGRNSGHAGMARP